MIIALAALMVIGALFLTLRIKESNLPPVESETPVKPLQEAKVRIYEALRDLQFEYRVGKLSDTDYQAAKQELQKELARVLQQLDEAGAAEVPAAKKPAAAKPAAAKPAAAAKAKAAAKINKDGSSKKKSVKVRYSTIFHTPKTLTLSRNPKYPRKSTVSKTRLDQFSTIKYPLTSEKAMAAMENQNTLVFIVDVKATKSQIASAVKQLYDVKAARVNTVIRPDGNKKALVKLTPDVEALEIASKIGVI